VVPVVIGHRHSRLHHGHQLPETRRRGVYDR
jgi:hypothetical protein